MICLWLKYWIWMCVCVWFRRSGRYDCGCIETSSPSGMKYVIGRSYVKWVCAYTRRAKRLKRWQAPALRDNELVANLCVCVCVCVCVECVCVCVCVCAERSSTASHVFSADRCWIHWRIIKAITGSLQKRWPYTPNSASCQLISFSRLRERRERDIDKDRGMEREREREIESG